MTRVAMSIAAVLLMLVAAWQWKENRSVPNSSSPAGQARVSARSVPGKNSIPAQVDSGQSSQPAQPADPLVPPLVIAGTTPEADYQPSRFELEAMLEPFEHDDRAHFHAHGEKVCASGCATSNHPTEKLTREHFGQLMAEFAGEPLNESSPALEALVYFGRQTSKLIDQYGDAPLDPLRAVFLRQELERTFAQIEIRVVDEAGEVRSWLPPTQVPLDRRHEFDMDVRDVQPLITSGTVKRVGLDHLWTRL